METLRRGLLLLSRGLRLRCPRCGRSKLFYHGFSMYAICPECGWRFEREEGYWTGAMAVNLIITELIVAAAVIPLAFAQAPMLPVFAIGLPATVALPLLFYRHAKSLWMTIDFMIHPVGLM